MNMTEAVAARLNSILKERGMRKKEFKELPEVKDQSVCNVFRTKCTPSLTMTTIYRITAALNMSMSEFFDDPIFSDIDIT